MIWQIIISVGISFEAGIPEGNHALPPELSSGTGGNAIGKGHSCVLAIQIMTDHEVVGEILRTGRGVLHVRGQGFS